MSRMILRGSLSTCFMIVAPEFQGAEPQTYMCTALGSETCLLSDMLQMLTTLSGDNTFSMFSTFSVSGTGDQKGMDPVISRNSILVPVSKNLKYHSLSRHDLDNAETNVHLYITLPRTPAAQTRL